MNTLTRREFLERAAILGLSASAATFLNGCGIEGRPAPTPTSKIYRVGILVQAGANIGRPRFDAFQKRMSELGYIEHRNLILDWRYADSIDERLPALAAELVRLPVDVLVTERGAALVAKQATNSIPIVFVGERYPVASGLIASIAHPGGNITGISDSPLIEKDLQILKQAVPSISRVAYFWEEGDASILDSIQNAARVEGVALLSIQIKNASEIEAALDSAIQAGADAVLVAVGPRIANRRALFQSLISQKRLPSITDFWAWADAGGLLAYGANPINNWALMANPVDKILKGAKPADLPVEAPTKYDFVINLKTAKELGITIPPSILAQATEVIQ